MRREVKVAGRSFAVHYCKGTVLREHKAVVGQPKPSLQTANVTHEGGRIKVLRGPVKRRSFADQ